MKTIRTKLVLIFMTLIITLIVSGILLNTIFLGAYYIYKTKGMMKSVSEKIIDEYSSDKENSYNDMNMIDSIDGISTIIIDKNFDIEHISISEKLNVDEKRLDKEIKQITSENKNKIFNKNAFFVFDNNNDLKAKLVYISQMNNGEWIILRKPGKNIRESVSIANEFYIIAGVIMIFIGGIFIIIFSNKLTKPIIEMSKVAENISNLEFEKRIIVDSEDEIGKLGESINKISVKLSTSINGLKQDVERRKQLVSNISHELKTPIGIIKGYAEGLKYGVVDDKQKMQRYCTILVEECDRMDILVRELLNHSKMEAGMVELNITSFDSYEFLSKIAERFNPSFIDKGISFDFKCVNNYVISADRNLLEKAINNYITNAIDHTEGRNFIQLLAEKKENSLKISVFNTGSNILMEDFDKIWDIYYKVDKSRSRKYGGHGLGLAIVKLIVKLHGGTTNVENLNDGVIFSFEIPNQRSKIEK